MNIKCIDKDIKALLEGRFYRIPRFQRPYSWDRENVEEFWSDSVTEGGAEHFIGSMVVFESGNDMYSLVDGQQRLTTVTMLLCAVRNALHDEGRRDLAEGIHQLIERRDLNNKLQFILQTETSYPYLQEHIQKYTHRHGPPESVAKMGKEEGDLKNAYELIDGKVRGAVEAIRGDTSISEGNKKPDILRKLLAIRDRVLQLKLIFVELEDEDDAYVIFETLNTRGKDLRVSDLVKNYLTKLLKQRNAKVDRTKDRWNSLVELTEQSSADISVDNFLHHLWLSQYEYTTIKKLFKAIKNRVDRGNASDFLETLCKDARIYREIHETSFRKWDKSEIDIRRSIDALNLFRVKQDLPMILSTMREYEANRLKPKHVVTALNAIENFHFMFTAVTSQRSSGGISFMYALHARELSMSATLEEKMRVIEELTRKLQSKLPSYQEFEANFLEILYSRTFTKQKKLVQYILGKIYRHHEKGGLPVDYDQITIEHLAPENPGEKTARLPATVVAQIGNLIATDKQLNDRLSNKPFPDKKAILRESNVWLDDVVKSAVTWGEKEIGERSRALARIAYYKAWKF